MNHTHRNHRNPEQETTLYALKKRRIKGSYTVEAAVVFPIFICLAVTILLLLRLVVVERGVSSALQEAAREAAVNNKLANTATVILLAEEKIQEKQVETRYVKGGSLGFNFLGSSVSETEIHLVCNYTVPVIGNFFSKKGILIHQEAVERRWIGWNPAMENDVKEDVYVYVTENGVAYHRKRDCAYLKPSIREVSAFSLDDARNYDGHRYGTCPYCKSGTVSALIYYITDYGENYHTTRSCTGLKRTVRMETEEAAIAEGYHICPKCGTN